MSHIYLNIQNFRFSIVSSRKKEDYRKKKYQSDDSEQANISSLWQGPSIPTSFPSYNDLRGKFGRHHFLNLSIVSPRGLHDVPRLWVDS